MLFVPSPHVFIHFINKLIFLQVEVSFIDYGNVEIVPLENSIVDIRHFNDALASIPQQVN